MANVLTNLASDLQRSAEIVGRSAVGFLPSVTINGGSEAVAQGQTVRAFTTVEGTINTSVTPSMTIPEGDDNTVGSDTLTLNQTVNCKIPFTGEDRLFLDGGSGGNLGPGFQTVYGALIARKMNGMMKNVESHLATVCYQAASRAVGTAGTTPFGSNFNTVAEARQILFDNDMWIDDNSTSLIVNSDASVNLRNLAQLQKANESGGTELLRQGELLNLQGVMLKESSQISAHTKGTGASYQTSAALAEGDTTIAVDTGTGTIVAGDIVTFAGSSHKYVVTAALSGGSFTIGGPGIQEAVADNTAVTVGANHTPNVVLRQEAVELAFRPMASPMASAASEQMVIQDPHSGLAWQVEVYGGYKKAMVDITAIYQAKVWTKDAVALLLG